MWLAMLGLDFLLNGAVFARIYQEGGPFMLAPPEAFRRIPLGYLAFLILAVAIVAIAERLRITTLAGGIRLGLVIGGAFGVVWGLSLYSIATLNVDAALAFAAVWLGLAVLGSAIAAISLARDRWRGLALAVVVFDLLCAATVIALQSFGVVPTLRA